MDENLAYWSASFNKQEDGSLRPSPLAPTLLPTLLIGYSLTCLAIMTVQHVSPLSNFNPHCGPITHSSTWSKPDSPVHPCSKLSLALRFVCNLRATFLVITSGIAHNTYSRCSKPLLHSVSGNARLPIHSKLLIALSYFALDVFHLFNSRDTHMFILGIPPDDFPL